MMLGKVCSILKNNKRLELQKTKSCSLTLNSKNSEDAFLQIKSFQCKIRQFLKCKNRTGLKIKNKFHTCFSRLAVIRFSVPEDHHVSLRCGGSDSSDVVWTHQDRTVVVTRQGSYETNEDPRRYLLLPDGSLRLRQLDDSDGGEYHCNQQLVAELQVLTGRQQVEL